MSLLIEQLVEYAKAHPGEVRIHLVGHSAGAVVLAAALQRLVTVGLPVESSTGVPSTSRSRSVGSDMPSNVS